MRFVSGLMMSTVSALVLFAGVAQAADPLEIKVGGFMNQWFGYSSNDIDNVQKFDQWSNAEIHFKGKTKLDNGISVGLDVQLEANSTGDQIDESYAWLESDFGKLIIGSENDAAYLAYVGAPNFGVPLYDGDLDQLIVNPTGSSLDRVVFGTTNITPAGDNDGQKITYLTPRWNGVQLGVSYLPDIDPTGGDRNALVLDTASYHDGFSVGLNYKDNFSGVDLVSAVGYQFAAAPEGTASDDFNAWTAGLNLGFGGFTLGGSYADVMDGAAVGATSTAGQAYDIGLGYEVGALGFSVTYFHGEMDGDVFATADDENNSYTAAIRYDLGKGVAVLGSVGYSELEGEVPGASDDNDGWYITSGLALRF